MKSFKAGTECTLKKPLFCPDNGETPTECNRSLLGQTKTKIIKKTGTLTSYTYYYCSKQCNPGYREEDLEKVFLEELELFLPDEEAMNDLINALGERVRNIRNVVRNEIIFLRKQSTEIEQKIERLYLNLDSGKIPEDLFNSQYRKFKQQREEILFQQRELEDENNDSADEVAEIIELAKDFKTKYLESDMKTKNRMLKMMYRTVYARKMPESKIPQPLFLSFYFIRNEPFSTLFEKGLEEKDQSQLEENRSKYELSFNWRGRRDLNSRPPA